MAIHFPVFDFSDTSYNQSKDAIIFQNIKAVKSYNAFRGNIKDVHPYLGITPSIAMPDRLLIRGIDYYEYLKAHPEELFSAKKDHLGIPNVAPVEENVNDLRRIPLGMYIDQLTAAGKTAMLKSNGYFAEAPGGTVAFPSVVPSIPLKSYLVQLQKQLPAEIEGWLKPSTPETASDTYKHLTVDPIEDVKYTVGEINDLLSEIKNVVSNLTEFAMVTVGSILDISYNTINTMFQDPSYEVKSVDAPLAGDLVPYVKSTNGKKFTGQFRVDNIDGVKYAARIEPITKGVSYRRVFYEDGIRYPKITPTEFMGIGVDLNSPEIAVGFNVSEDSSSVTTSLATYSYKELEPTLGNSISEFRQADGTVSNLSDLTENNEAATYLLMQMITKFVHSIGSLNIPIDKLAEVGLAEAATSNTIILYPKRTLKFYFSPEVLQEIVNRYEAAIKIDFDGLGAVVNDQKDTPLGKVLGASGYLEGLLQTTSLDKLDQLYISYYIPLTKNVNSLRDEDTPIDREQYGKLVQLVGNRMWKYVDVCVVKDTGYVLDPNTGEHTGTFRGAAVALVPNWDAIKSAPPRLAGMILNTMMLIENHPKKPKKNIIGAILTTLVAIVVSVIAPGNPIGYFMIAAAWAGAAAQFAFYFTGAEQWNRVATTAAVVSAVVSMGASLKTALLQLKTSTAVLAALKLASIGIGKYNESETKKLQDKAKAIEDETRDIIEMDDYFDIAKKVDKFIFTDSYNEKYNYSSRFVDKPKRC